MDGLANVNIELTSRCNKNCWMCGRRKVDRDYPEMANSYGDMDIEMVKDISQQLPTGITIQFHNNGEPLLYPKLREAIDLFPGRTKCLTTNGKLLLDRAEDLIMLDTIAISVIENDPEAEEQFETIQKYMYEHYRPLVIIRFVGNPKTIPRYTSLVKKHGGLLTQRTLHNPMGSFSYKNSPTIPETGICREMMHSLAISRNGDVSCCVRFDPERIGVVSNMSNSNLRKIWHSDVRQRWTMYHRTGNRDRMPLCRKCDYWGIPTSDWPTGASK
jgi:radical SAM protein with 4Fe4S-binding SPASM domain